jgi:hypothetical protein
VQPEKERENLGAKIKTDPDEAIKDVLLKPEQEILTSSFLLRKAISKKIPAKVL